MDFILIIGVILILKIYHFRHFLIFHNVKKYGNDVSKPFLNTNFSESIGGTQNGITFIYHILKTISTPFMLKTIEFAGFLKKVWI